VDKDEFSLGVSSLPRHLFIPDQVTGIDLRKVGTVTAGSVNVSLFSFTAPRGAVTRFISYGVFSDAALCADTEFLPTVDGSRIFPFHGDPSDNFKICLGLAPDLSNNSLILCQLQLEPGQVLEWFLTNTGAVDTVMGVRMVGYFDVSQIRTAPRFGG
jgi:hypothetical protein